MYIRLEDALEKNRLCTIISQSISHIETPMAATNL